MLTERRNEGGATLHVSADANSHGGPGGPGRGHRSSAWRGVRFEMTPDALDRIQIRGVRRQIFQRDLAAPRPQDECRCSTVEPRVSGGATTLSIVAVCTSVPRISPFEAIRMDQNSRPDPRKHQAILHANF